MAEELEMPVAAAAWVAEQWVEVPAFVVSSIAELEPIGPGSVELAAFAVGQLAMASFSPGVVAVVGDGCEATRFVAD